MTRDMQNVAARHVLLISYHYPPVGGSGVQRAAYMAQHLTDTGWRVHVLRAGDARHPLRDESLLRVGGDGDAPIVHSVVGWDAGGAATRLTGWLPGASMRDWLKDRIAWRLEGWQWKWIVPEPQRFWVGSAIRAAVKLAQQTPIQAIISTSPPHSVQLAAAGIARRLGIPWIADLRDPITDNFAQQSAPQKVRRAWEQIERRIMSEADAMVVTCEDLKHRLAARHGRADAIEVITNGFDDEIQPHRLRVGVEAGGVHTKPNRPLCITSVGSFYQQQSVDLMLEALRRVNGNAREPLFQWRIVGSVSAQQQARFEPSDERFIERVGYVPHSDAVLEMSRAELLFLMTPETRGGELCIPAKTFEYLAYGGHVLALVHQGTHLMDVLRKAGNVTIVAHQDSAAATLATALEQCVALRNTGRLESPRDRSFVQQFARRRQAEAFAGMLDRVCSLFEGRPRSPSQTAQFAARSPTRGLALAGGAGLVEAGARR